MRPTRDLSPGVRRLLWAALTLAVSLFGAARAAHAEQLYADLDRDGIRDVILHNGAWNAVIKVWLSGTASTRALRTRLPLVWVRVIDLDGDGRLDVIGADKTTRVHVWHYRHGRLRPVHSNPSHSRASYGSPNRLARQSGSDDVAIPVGGTDPLPCDAPAVPGLASLLGLQSVRQVALGRPASCVVVLPPPRAPPACP